jgi:hypothetical protein
MGMPTRSEVYRRFMERLPIRYRNRRIGPLRFNAEQEVLWRAIAPLLDGGERCWYIVLKARRIGISTFSEALITAFCALEPQVKAMVIAHEAAATKRVWEISKGFVQWGPLQAVAKVGRQSLAFGDSVLEFATAGSPHAARSADLTAVHLDESAFWPKPEAMLAVLQCVPSNTFSVIAHTSTANGLVDDGELFCQEWERAEAGESEFTPVFLPWYLMPEYRVPGGRVLDPSAEERELAGRLGLSEEQLAWRRWAIKSLCQGDVRKFRQEYPSTAEEAFVVSGQPFFAPEQLLPLQRHIEPGTPYRIEATGELRRHDDGQVRVWRVPKPGRRYVIGADSAMGIADEAHSRSAAEVLDMETLEQVAEYEAPSAPHVFARHLAVLGRLYNYALLAPEVQSSGGGGGRELITYLLQEHKYWHLHRWKHPDKVRYDAGNLYGWETNARSRPRMLARVQEVVLDGSALIHSRALLRQLAYLGENESGRYEALAGHDDLLMAYAIALVSRAENYFTPQPQPPTATTVDWAGLGIHVVPTVAGGVDWLRLHQRWLADAQRPVRGFMAL